MASRDILGKVVGHKINNTMLITFQKTDKLSTNTEKIKKYTSIRHSNQTIN